jgi:tight adherence protein B
VRLGLPDPGWLEDPPPVPYLVMAGGVFVALLLVAFVIVSPMLTLTQKRRRLVQLERYRMAEMHARLAAASVPGGPLTHAALSLTERAMRSGGLEDRFARQLDRAGMTLRPQEWVLLRAALAVGAAVLLTLVIGPLGVPFGLFFGWMVTAVYHRRRARLKSERFSTQLPEALQLVIGSLRSGFSLPQALDAMLRESGEPMTTEFGRAMAETRLGMSLEDALDRLAVRVHNPDLSWAVMAIRVQREVGGNLAEVLSSTVETIRERERLRGHVRALSAEGRISAWILVALPICSAAFMFTFRSEYITPLVTDPRGLLMLLVAVALLCVGGFWLSRVVKVEI